MGSWRGGSWSRLHQLGGVGERCKLQFAFWMHQESRNASCGGKCLVNLGHWGRCPPPWLRLCAFVVPNARQSSAGVGGMFVKCYTLFSGQQQNDAETKSVKRQDDVYRTERPESAAVPVHQQRQQTVTEQPSVTHHNSSDLAKSTERQAPQTSEQPVRIKQSTISTHQSPIPPVSRDHESRASQTDVSDVRPLATSPSHLMVTL